MVGGSISVGLLRIECTNRRKQLGCWCIYNLSRTAVGGAKVCASIQSASGHLIGGGGVGGGVEFSCDRIGKEPSSIHYSSRKHFFLKPQTQTTPKTNKDKDDHFFLRLRTPRTYTATHHRLARPNTAVPARIPRCGVPSCDSGEVR